MSELSLCRWVIHRQDYGDGQVVERAAVCIVAGPDDYAVLRVFAAGPDRVPGSDFEVEVKRSFSDDCGWRWPPRVGP